MAPRNHQPRPTMTGATRTSFAALVVLLVSSAAIALVVWSRTSGHDAAVRDAASRYVDLVATGDADELPGLAGMTAGSSAALTDAGSILSSATERIRVDSVGEPVPASEPPDLPPNASLVDFREVEVHYTLDDQEHEWTVALGRIAGEEGDEPAHWRITTPMVGSVAWDQPGYLGEDTEIWVNGTRLVRRPRVQDEPEETTQPLYPAVYDVQHRLAPYFRSSAVSLPVAAGEPTAQPDLPLEPTATTRAIVRRTVKARFETCGSKDGFKNCPVFDLVESVGGDPRRSDWWLGLTGPLKISYDPGPQVAGRFRYAGPDGVRTIAFTGTGTFGIDTSSGKPFVASLDLEEAR